ncbi:MAG TPA: ABC transporter permease [Thermomicrobiales bacterium]|nr:ABC transporter permease [Thermomicrobiales bacterium]
MMEQNPPAIGAPVGPVAARRRTMNQTVITWASRNARILAPLTSLLAMVIFFSLVTDTFLGTRNLQNIVTQVGPIAVAATGVTFVLLCAEIDLSIASVATFSGMISSMLLVGGTISLGFTSFSLSIGSWGILVAIAVAALIGLLNGVFVSYVGIPSFMMTLAMLTIAHGLAVFVNKGESIYKVPNVLHDVAIVGNQVLGIPVIGLVALGTLIIGEFVLGYTRFGRYVYMTGGNRAAAELSGVDTRRVIMLCLMICGLTAGVAGLLAAGRINQANPNANTDLLIGTIAAVVLGGTSLFGGEGGMKNTVLGVLIFGVLSNGLNLLPNISFHFKEALQGIILVGALLLNVLALRLERVSSGAE